MRDLHRLIEAVQRNCDIADARHARDMTMCVYLLQMREFYRWEHGIALAAPIDRAELGRWLAAREKHWAALEDAEYAPLPVADGEFGPFEVFAINRALLPHGLLYGGGIGRFGKPHFFLGRLARRERRDALELRVAGCEYARDMGGVTAALQDGVIVLREEVLARWLWEKFELWGMRRSEGALGAALEHYGFASDPQAALARMTAQEGETLVLHEMGEARAGDLLGTDWDDLLASLSDRRAEIVARAVRDNLADCLVTLPALVERGPPASLHFFFANFEGMREALFPELRAAYRCWRERGDARAVLRAAAEGASRWGEVAAGLLEQFRTHPQEAGAALARLAQDRPGAQRASAALRPAECGAQPPAAAPLRNPSP